jgi:hypothetical protein
LFLSTEVNVADALPKIGLFGCSAKAVLDNKTAPQSATGNVSFMVASCLNMWLSVNFRGTTVRSYRFGQLPHSARHARKSSNLPTRLADCRQPSRHHVATKPTTGQQVSHRHLSRSATWARVREAFFAVFDGGYIILDVPKLNP